MPKIKRILSIAALGFTLACSTIFVVDFTQRQAGNLRAKTSVVAHEQIEPAYLHDSVGTRKNSFRILEPVFTRERYKKLQSCHSTISNVFINTQSKYIYRGESYVTWVPIGDYDISESTQLPPNIVPGEYRFVRKTVSFCGGDQVYYTTNFDLKFEIVGP
ncbi:MAG: hypothetical protein EOO77_41055 [Oxalobacteraceae bacterium]|nr:MAG: hypothetical protein EOO77_41055 [Oxalobacteraceae bacterium]